MRNTAALILCLLCLLRGSVCSPLEPSALPDNIEILVSGHPAPNFFLKAIAFDSVTSALRERGYTSSTVFLDRISAPQSLAPGETAAITVPVKATRTAHEHPQDIRVTMKNAGLRTKDDDYLMISNDPEVIPKEGILFQGELKGGESARFLYYHAVPQGSSYDLMTLIHNPTGSPIEIFASIGLGGPSGDGIYAGHMATRRFMKRMKYGAGKIINIPPGTSHELIRQRLLPSTDTGTAIAKIWLISGSMAKIELAALSPGGTKTDLPVIDCIYDNGRISSYIYSASTVIEREIRAKDRKLDIRIGEKPVFYSLLRNPDIHLGNYGLLHRIKVKLTNDKEEDRIFSIRYSARGGPARGIFLIEGNIYQTGLLGVKKEDFEEILKVFVPSNTLRELEILLMPQPGSYYPTVLSVIPD